MENLTYPMAILLGFGIGIVFTILIHLFLKEKIGLNSKSPLIFSCIAIVLIIIYFFSMNV